MSPLLLITLLSQVLMGATNLGIAVLLKHHFGPLVFNEYIGITNVAMSVAICLRGIQAVTAQEFSIAESQNRTRHSRGDLSAVSLGFLVGALWIVTSPLLSSALRSSIISAVSGSTLFVGASLGARGLGKLQGQERFVAWQTLIVLFSLLQIPIAILTISIGAPLSVFIVLLNFPSIGIYAYATLLTRKVKPQTVKKRIRSISRSSLAFLFSALSIQWPIVFLNRVYSGSLIGDVTILLVIFGIASNSASTLGSFLLPRYERGLRRELNTRDAVVPHIANASLVLLVAVALYPVKDLILDIFGRDSARSSIGIDAYTLAALGCFVWAAQISFLQERLAARSTISLVVGGSLAIIEVLILANLISSPVLYFTIHLVFGVLALSWFSRFDRV